MKDNNDNNDNKNNKTAVMLDKGEAPYLSEDASNLFTFMTVTIIIQYILNNVSCASSALSISPYTALVFCVVAYLRMLYTIALSVNMRNVQCPGKM